MKTFKALQAIPTAFVALALVASSAAQAGKWTTHNYSADGFSISLPSDPQIHTQKDPAGSQMRSYTIDLGQGALMIGVMQFGSMVPSKGPDAILQDGKNGALAQGKAHLVSEKKITLGAAPGLDFEAENPTTHFRAQVFLVGKTAYQLVEAYPIGKPFGQAPEFFDSFRLIAAEPASSRPAATPEPVSSSTATSDQPRPAYGPLAFNSEGADFYIAQNGKFAPAAVSDGTIEIHLHPSAFQIGYNGEQLNLCLAQSPFPEIQADPKGFKASCLSGPFTGAREPNSDSLLVYGGRKWSDGNNELSDETSMKATPMKGFRFAYQVNQLFFLEARDKTLSGFKGTLYGYIAVYKQPARSNKDIMPVHLIFE